MKDPLAHNLVETPPMPDIRCKSPTATWDFFEIARIEATFARCTHAAFPEHAEPLGLQPLCDASPLYSAWTGVPLFASPPTAEEVSPLIKKLLDMEPTLDTDVLCLLPRTEQTRYLDEDLGLRAVTLIASPIRFPRPWKQTPYPHSWLIEWNEETALAG